MIGGTPKSKRESDLEKAIRAKGMKLERGRRVIDRLISVNPSSNP
jgi:hypothetical protein